MERNEQLFDEIKQSMKPLFEKARAEGLWFYHDGFSGPFWMTPNQLQRHQDNNKFVWGPVNWELRHPSEREEYLLLKVRDAQAALDAWRQSILDEGRGE